MKNLYHVNEIVIVGSLQNAVNDRMEMAEGRDFEIDPIEIPPVRELMTGDINFAIGLANDAIGYIMPKTHWDREPPFTYGKTKAMYGEINSLGPDAGPVFYAQIKSLIEGHSRQE